MSEQETTPQQKAKQTPTAAQETKPASTDKPKKRYSLGTGRRKSSIARVRVCPGQGKFLINSREIENYFTEIQDRNNMAAPLKETKMLGRVDVIVSVHGGGTTGQAGAILLGLARALMNYDSSLESVLRDCGFMTRDARRVERKKYGQPGARRRFQFSKR